MQAKRIYHLDKIYGIFTTIFLWDDELLNAILMRLIICLTNYVTVRNYKVNKFILSNESGTVKQKLLFIN